MTKAAKIGAILIITAGIAFLGLLGGGQHDPAQARKTLRDPMRDHYAHSMPRYPGAREFPLGGKLSAGVNGMKMSYFMTEDEPLEVAGFYIQRWKAAGYHVTEDISPGGGVVGAYDPSTGVLRQIVMRRRGKLTRVFPSQMARPFRHDHRAKRHAEDVPLYPGSEGILSFGARDPGHRSRVTMLFNYGGLAANVDHLRTMLPTHGWAEVRPKGAIPLPADTHQTLIFHKGGRELTINITELNRDKRTRVHITEATGQELGLPTAKAR